MHFQATRRQFALKTAAALSLAVGAVSLCPAPGVAQTTQSPVNLADARNADLQQLVVTLNDAAADPRARDEAARRMASRQTPEARQQLLIALNNAGNPRGQLAAARALASESSPDPSFIDPLFGLIGPDRQLSDAACQALMAYKVNPQVTERLLDLARNTQAHQNARIAATQALGGFAHKPIAEALVTLTRPDVEPSGAIRNAAADALAAMTGLHGNGRDSARWQRWWTTQADKGQAVFRDEWLARRSARLDDQAAAQQQMAEEFLAELTEKYRATSDNAAREAMLIRWMQSSVPQVRAAAARFVVEDFQESRIPSETIKEHVRALIGDSSPLVRLETARTIRAINDTGALNPLLTQLSQETVNDVRVALIGVLARYGDSRAVPEVEKLLNDESLAVAEAAAEAMASLGKNLRERNRGAAVELSKRLRRVFEERAAQPGAERLRESLVEAMPALADPESLRLFVRLLKREESDRVRRAALRGIAVLKDPKAADVVQQWLKQETVPAVRREAIIALGSSGSTVHLQTLFDYMQPSIERDANVREEAWRQFSSLLPNMDAAQISRWTGQFQAFPERRVIVLKALAEKLLADRNVDELAKTRENIGETIMRTPEPDYAEAALYLKMALDYHRQAGSPKIVTEKLIGRYVDAQLLAEKYAEAAQFASEMIAADREQLGLGAKFRVEAERLRDKKDYQKALKLIEESRKIKAFTNTRYAQQLSEVEGEVRRLSQDNKGNGGRGEETGLPLAAR